MSNEKTKQIQEQRRKNPNDEVEAEGKIQHHTLIWTMTAVVNISVDGTWAGFKFQIYNHKTC
jgi:hypothetical protein